MSFKEYDIVVTVKDLINVPKGSKGTILIIYSTYNFEVEFFDNSCNSLAILTVESKDLKPSL